MSLPLLGWEPVNWRSLPSRIKHILRSVSFLPTGLFDKHACKRGFTDLFLLWLLEAIVLVRFTMCLALNK